MFLSVANPRRCRPDCSTGRGSCSPALLADASRSRAQHAARGRVLWVLCVSVCDGGCEHDVGQIYQKGKRVGYVMIRREDTYGSWFDQSICPFRQHLSVESAFVPWDAECLAASMKAAHYAVRTVEHAITEERHHADATFIPWEYAHCVFFVAKRGLGKVWILQ